jgi:hypothetical protein
MAEMLKLPETVVICSLCKGWGEYMQRWCDAPASIGTCDLCEGAQFVYHGLRCEPAPESVRQQIAQANELVEADRRTLRGGRLYYRSADQEQPWGTWPFQHQVDADPKYRRLLGSAFAARAAR